MTGGSDGVAKAFFTNVVPVTRPDSLSCNRKYAAAIMRSALNARPGVRMRPGILGRDAPFPAAVSR
jgi:hypothetical protein